MSSSDDGGELSTDESTEASRIPEKTTVPGPSTEAEPIITSAESATQHRADGASRSTPRARKGFSTSMKVLSATVAVVGAITGVITVVSALTRDVSGFSSLSVTAAPSDSGVKEFALPLSFIDSDFPASDQPCSKEQLAWLDDHAEPVQRRFRVSMRNNAGEGAMLALVDFRADVKPDGTAPATHVLVVCAEDSVTPTARAAGLEVDLSDATARFRALGSSQQSQPIPDIPVSWNLAPGETGTLDIELSAEHSAKGALVVTALSGRDKSDVKIEGTEFTLPGFWRRGESYLLIGASGMECARNVTGLRDICTDDDLTDLRRARDAVYADN